VRAASWRAPPLDAAARIYGVMLDDMAGPVGEAAATALGLQPGRGP